MPNPKYESLTLMQISKHAEGFVSAIVPVGVCLQIMIPTYMVRYVKVLLLSTVYIPKQTCTSVVLSSFTSHLQVTYNYMYL